MKRKKSKKTRPTFTVTFDMSTDSGRHKARVFLVKTRLHWDSTFHGDFMTLTNKATTK
jgi:hypothetical protein